jgi:transcriptional regulator GlxA family with amidase domain
VAQADKNMASSDDYRMEEVLRCIESEPSKTVRDLANLVNLSSSRLSHLFKLQTGVSLNRFLSDVRLRRAAELLKSTEIQIKEVSYIVGYHQTSSFDRAFRNKFALSPADYRMRQRFKLIKSQES